MLSRNEVLTDIFVVFLFKLIVGKGFAIISSSVEMPDQERGWWAAESLEFILM